MSALGRVLTGGMRFRLRSLPAAAALCAVIGVTASCAGGHATLGTSSGNCFLALSSASQTVHGSGKFVGVKLYKAHGLIAALAKQVAKAERAGKGGNPFAPFGSAPSGTPKAPGTVPNPRHLRHVLQLVDHKLRVFDNNKVCVVEYQGAYGPGSVSYAMDPQASGKYAFVVLPEKGGTPVVSLVVRRLPLIFKHVF